MPMSQHLSSAHLEQNVTGETVDISLVKGQKVAWSLEEVETRRIRGG
jgi:hypothetical protein